MRGDPFRALVADPALARLASLAAARGASLHLVGGTVRDLLLGRPPADLDVAVGGAHAPDLARAFADAVGGRVVPLDDTPPTARVVRPGIPPPAGVVDLAGYRGPTLAEDLALRDFTVNALAVPLAPLLAGEAPPPIDPTGGLADLRARRIRMTAARVFDDDPLRVLRAFRLAATLGFRLDRRTARAAAARASRLADVSAERIAAESFRLLALPDARTWLAALRRAGLLEGAFRLAGQPGAARLEALGRLERVLADPRRTLGAAAVAAVSRLEVPLAAGRPRAAVLRFLVVAGPEAPQAAERLRLAAREVAWTARLEAAQPAIAAAARSPGLPDPAALVRDLVRPLGEEAEAALLVACAVAPPGTRTATRRFVTSALACLAEVVRPRLAAPRPLSGEDLVRECGIAPGPAVGRLLAWLDEARAAGLVADREGALAFVRARIEEACRAGEQGA